MINGVTDIVITKLDVLDEFDSINYCHSYTIEGNTSDELPFDICDNDIKPEYQEVNGWASSLDDVKEYENLPKLAKDYIDTLEDKLETKISIISTGPERHKILIK